MYDPSHFTSDEQQQLVLMRAQETDALISARLLGEALRHESPLEQSIDFPFKECVLRIRTGPRYPIQAPEFEVSNVFLP